MMKSWLSIQELPRARRGNTGKFRVFAIKDHIYLGKIIWKTGWRQYAFFPIENSEFSHECLSQLANFIKRRMEEQKIKKDLKGVRCDWHGKGAVHCQLAATAIKKSGHFCCDRHKFCK